MQKPTPIISDSMKTILSSLLGFHSLDQDSMGNNSSAILESIYKLFTQIEEEKSLMFDITMKQRQLDAINENKRHKELMEIIESKNQSNQDQAKEIDKKQKEEAVLGVVRQMFKPEFLNRLDDIILFNSYFLNNVA